VSNVIEQTVRSYGSHSGADAAGSNTGLFLELHHENGVVVSGQLTGIGHLAGVLVSDEARVRVASAINVLVSVARALDSTFDKSAPVAVPLGRTAALSFEGSGASSKTILEAAVPLYDDGMRALSCCLLISNDKVDNFAGVANALTAELNRFGGAAASDRPRAGAAAGGADSGYRDEAPSAARSAAPSAAPSAHVEHDFQVVHTVERLLSVACDPLITNEVAIFVCGQLESVELTTGAFERACIREVRIV
jgi:hypothetical protein